MWDQKPFFTKLGVVLNPAIPYSDPALGDAIYKTFSQRLPKGQKSEVPFAVYLRNGLGDEYIANVVFSVEAYTGNIFVKDGRMVSITAQRWSDKAQ